MASRIPVRFGFLSPARAGVLALALGVLGAGMVAAQQTSPSGSGAGAGMGPGAGKGQGAGMGAGACRDDATRLCPNSPRGGGAVANCLHDHMDDLSPGCREMMAGRENVRTACAADVAALCKDAGDRPMLRLRCLSQNRDKLSAGCKAALEDVHPAP